MTRRLGWQTAASLCAALALALSGAACSGGGDGTSAPPIGVEPTPPVATPTPGPGPGPDPTPSDCDVSFESTFDGIQQTIFEAHGCTQQVCHGSSAQGGLQLSADVAYENIFEKPSLASSLRRIEPGDEERSFLWLKVAAGTRPGQITVPGSPMPSGLQPLSENQLELLRLWIYGGAPKEGVVIGSEKLLDGCLPDPEPISITPLEPPAPADGIQWVMPPWLLPANSQIEGCIATYYDFTGKIPEEYLDPTGEYWRWSGFELRQDPQSHHMLLYYSPLNLEPGGIDVHDPSFGTWTCRGGDLDGQVCEPTDLDSCGAEGICASEFQDSFACVAFGPSGPPAEIVGGAGQSQAYMPFADGVFQQLPLKGVLYWNPHAFNITEKDHVMNGRLNYFFAKKQVHQAARVSNFSAIFAPNNPPFTKETFCNDHTFPIGARVFHLFAHTHRHGEHFWVTMPDGTQIYESFDFSDPVQARYDPPLAFDSPDRAERTVRYCAVYNNGLKPDGSFDIDLVTRASRVPPSAEQFIGSCSPVACVAGKIGAPCDGEDDDAACDSSPGAGDGWCDACNITGGESTENEMFVLFGAYYIDPTVPGADLSELPY